VDITSALHLPHGEHQSGMNEEQMHVQALGPSDEPSLGDTRVFCSTAFVAVGIDRSWDLSPAPRSVESISHRQHRNLGRTTQGGMHQSTFVGGGKGGGWGTTWPRCFISWRSFLAALWAAVVSTSSLRLFATLLLACTPTLNIDSNMHC